MLTSASIVPDTLSSFSSGITSRSDAMSSFVFSAAFISGSLIGVERNIVAVSGLPAMAIVHFDMFTVIASSEELCGLTTLTSIFMSSIDLGSDGYCIRPFSALSRRSIAGILFSPYTPFTVPAVSKVPCVLTPSSILAYWGGSIASNDENSVFPDPRRTSRSIPPPSSIATEPSHRRSMPLRLKLYFSPLVSTVNTILSMSTSRVISPVMRASFTYLVPSIAKVTVSILVTVDNANCCERIEPLPV